MAFASISALAAVIGAVIGAVIVVDGARARAIDAGGLDYERSASGGSVEARAILACRNRSWAECAKLSRSILRNDPVDSVSWLRLAEASSGLQGGRLGVEGLAALAASYRVSPLGYERLIERFRFSLDHWEQLPADLQVQTREQLRAGWIVGGSPYGRMRAYAADGADPFARSLVATWSREVEGTPLAYPDITRQGIQMR